MQRAALGLVGALLLAPPLARAGDSAAARPIDRATAVRLGAERGPGVATAAAALPGNQQAADAAKAPLVLPPRISLGAGRRFGPDAGLELQIGAMLDVPLGPVGTARAASASAQLASISADVRRARLDGALHAGVAWSRAAEAREVLKLRLTSGAQAKAIFELAKVRVQSGAGQPVESALAATEVGLADAQSLDAEGLLVDALAELQLSIGVAPLDSLEPVGEICAADGPVIDEKTALAAAREQNPTLALARARAAGSRSEVRLVTATLAPTMGFGVSFLRGSLGEQIYLGVVTLPLPFAEPAAFDKARAVGVADAADAEAVRVEAQLAKEVHVAVHDQTHTREVRDKLQGGAVGPAREALRLAKLALASGTEPVTFVLIARQKLVAIEELLVHACGEVVRADLRLERLMGRPS